MSIKKELEEYWRADKALREKIYEKFDKMNKKVDFYLTLDNTEEEIHFVEIRDELLIEEHGTEWCYKSLKTSELLDVWDSLEQED